MQGLYFEMTRLAVICLCHMPTWPVKTLADVQRLLHLTSPHPQLQQSLDMQVTMGMSKEGETDELKKVFLEGNPFFLVRCTPGVDARYHLTMHTYGWCSPQGLTMVVSLLHSVFDMFAFKNDIGFWRNKDNLTGLSVRTILINSFCQLIIFLYLLDSETSFVVLASSFVGTLIEFWKVRWRRHSQQPGTALHMCHLNR